MNQWVLVAVAMILGGAWFVRALSRAPIGLEDHRGFHVFRRIVRRHRPARVGVMYRLRRQRILVRRRPNLVQRAPADGHRTRSVRGNRLAWLRGTPEMHPRFRMPRPPFDGLTARDADTL